jgi:hypothetical protein
MSNDKKPKEVPQNPIPGGTSGNDNNTGDTGNDIPFVPPTDRTNLNESVPDWGRPLSSPPFGPDLNDE